MRRFHAREVVAGETTGAQRRVRIVPNQALARSRVAFRAGLLERARIERKRVEIGVCRVDSAPKSGEVSDIAQTGQVWTNSSGRTSLARVVQAFGIRVVQILFFPGAVFGDGPLCVM